MTPEGVTLARLSFHLHFGATGKVMVQMDLPVTADSDHEALAAEIMPVLAAIEKAEQEWGR